MKMESMDLKYRLKTLSKIIIQKTSRKKMRSSVKVRQDKGYYFGSKAPYGYVKDEKDHHKLIVDERVRHKT